MCTRVCTHKYAYIHTHTYKRVSTPNTNLQIDAIGSKKGC